MWGLLSQTIAITSPRRSPCLRRACARRRDWSSSWPKVTVSPVPAMISAARSGSVAAWVPGYIVSPRCRYPIEHRAAEQQRDWVHWRLRQDHSREFAGAAATLDGMTQQGRQVAIVEAVRTPIGPGHREKGAFRDLHPATLLARTYTALIQRAGIDASEVEDVVTGCVQQFGEQGLNIGRTAWLQAGLPVKTAATTIDRQCGSSQQAVNFATALIASGTHDWVVAAGVEHMGRIPLAAGPESRRVFGDPFTEQLLARHALTDQGTAAEVVADHYEIARSELDELALRSHRLAARATDLGDFAREIVPITINGHTVT